MEKSIWRQAFENYGNLIILRDIINFDNHYAMDNVSLSREECIECFDQYTATELSELLAMYEAHQKELWGEK